MIRQLRVFQDQDEAMSIVMSGQSTKISARSELEAIKHKIANGYSQTARGTRHTWNWGMRDDALHRALSSIVPGYDQFESDGYSEQLYYYTLSSIPHESTQPRRVLEVGCGVGGGLSFLSRLEGASRFVGLDLAKTAIEHAQSRFARGEALQYRHGDAENLPFGNAEFDAVINVESSHNYPHFERFIREVSRVLKPGGHFAMVDAFTPSSYQELKRVRDLSEIGLRWLDERDISEQVRHAVRTRRKRGSTFRRQVEQPWPLPLNYLAAALLIRVYGGLFIDEGRLVSAFFKLSGFSAISGIDSYRHFVATRVADVAT
jgi:ubiquinone/menaquinone biosynthesis C-methylase UbiE